MDSAEEKRFYVAGTHVGDLKDEDFMPQAGTHIGATLFRDKLNELESHTNERLDRLEERVREYEDESKKLNGIWDDDFNEGFNDACNKVLQLIQDLKDE